MTVLLAPASGGPNSDALTAPRRSPVAVPKVLVGLITPKLVMTVPPTGVQCGCEDVDCGGTAPAGWPPLLAINADRRTTLKIKNAIRVILPSVMVFFSCCTGITCFDAHDCLRSRERSRTLPVVCWFHRKLLILHV